MAKIFELKIKDSRNIYQEIAKALSPYREGPQGSVIFIVEGTKNSPIIGLRYPGRKIKKRTLKRIAVNSALWANLLDFEVIPYKNGKEVSGEFTFEKILRDFKDNKVKSKEFWKLIEEIFYDNKINKKPPILPGIDPNLFLLAIKWIWIQEDLNYKLNWKEVWRDEKEPIRYVLETRTGSSTSGGAGRAKFFAALILLKYYFTFEQVKKIIPLY